MPKLDLIHEMWQALDNELFACIMAESNQTPSLFHEMMLYQLGWSGTVFDKALTGKRIRPLLMLLTVDELGGEWEKALPAAAALELVHNFSLVHDDIQDHSETRRGRDTAWVKWGEAQAINTGDAMLTLANMEVLKLIGAYPDKTVLDAASTIILATLRLTQGQFLDLAHENAEEVTLEHYWQMVGGKTGALFAANFRIGALLAGIPEEQTRRFEDLGNKIGLAFQIQDDYLGIWGRDEETGKSNETDLISRKKTFPVQYALENMSGFREFWTQHPHFGPLDVAWMKEKLAEGRVDEETLSIARNYYSACLAEIAELFGYENYKSGLTGLITSLFNRMK